ncbi:MAG: class I SAM-dependent methyltransferase [Bacteroidales bacterium]|nr:class I SAM-dependent methyltransferase [Bacteroidales bacterium]
MVKSNNIPQINSPLNGGKTKLIETIDSAAIIKRYKKKLSIDVSRFFLNVPQVFVYECDETKYRFFYPLHISGDGLFYEQLQDSKGYYLPWKWEHQKAIEHIKPTDNLLEIGSARGAFLEGLKKHFGNNFNAMGVELNEDAAKKAQMKGINIEIESIENLSEKRAQQFDVVCFFQVLEHISDVLPFMRSAVKCLKTNGRIIVSVPNNDSFIKDIPMNILNLPPHHMGLWSKESLTKLAEIVGLVPVNFYTEALSPLHVWSYYHVKIIRIFGNNIFSKLMLIPLLPLIWFKKSKGMNPSIEGHTILAVFKKI